MEKQIERFRRQVDALFGTSPGPGVRYPEALRALAVQVALAELSEGQRLGSVARELGVGVGTLQRWFQAMAPEGGSLRAVEIVNDDANSRKQSAPDGLVLVTATGHRVEGLALGEVALLLESLV